MNWLHHSNIFKRFHKRNIPDTPYTTCTCNNISDYFTALRRVVFFLSNESSGPYLKGYNHEIFFLMVSDFHPKSCVVYITRLQFAINTRTNK